MKKIPWGVLMGLLVWVVILIGGIAVGINVSQMDLQKCISTVKRDVDIMSIDLIQLESKIEACKLLFNDD